MEISTVNFKMAPPYILLWVLVTASLTSITGCGGAFGPYEQRYERIQTLTEDSEGNVFVVGQFPDKVDFDPGPGVFELTPKGFPDAFISKFDPDGNFLWAGQMGGDGWCDIMDLAADNSGNMYLTGQVWDTVDMDPGSGQSEVTASPPNAEQASSHLSDPDAFISKLNPDGNLIWIKSWGSNYSEVSMSIAVDSEGNAYVTGAYWDTVDFDPGPDEEIHTATPVSSEEEARFGKGGLLGDGNGDVFLSKFDPDGNFLWTAVWGGTENDRGDVVEVDQNGNPIVSGYFTDIVDFDPGPESEDHTATDNLDLFLCKYDSDGNYLWADSWHGGYYDYMSRTTSAGVSPSNMDIGIASDSDGNAYIHGSFYDTVDLDPGSGSDVHNSGEYGSYFVVKLDQMGEFSWARAWSGPDGPDGPAFSSTGAPILNFMHGRSTGPSGLMEGGPRGGGGTFSDEYDLLFTSFDVDGNFAGATTFRSNGAWDYWHVTGDRDGKLLVAGTFTGTVDLDPGPKVDERSSKGEYDLFLSKFDSDHNLQWTVTWGLTENDVALVYD